MPVYAIAIMRLFPRQQDPPPHRELICKVYDNDEQAKERGREAWKTAFVGAEKRITILRRDPSHVSGWVDVFKFTNQKK